MLIYVICLFCLVLYKSRKSFFQVGRSKASRDDDEEEEDEEDDDDDEDDEEDDSVDNSEFDDDEGFNTYQIMLYCI